MTQELSRFSEFINQNGVVINRQIFVMLPPEFEIIRMFRMLPPEDSMVKFETSLVNTLMSKTWRLARLRRQNGRIRRRRFQAGSRSSRAGEVHRPG